MTAFTIIITHGEKPTKLIIIPKDDYYKVEHAQRIIGALKKAGADWILMDANEIEPSEPVPFEHKPTLKADRITLGAVEINQITGEIENHLKLN